MARRPRKSPKSSKAVVKVKAQYSPAELRPITFQVDRILQSIHRTVELKSSRKAKIIVTKYRRRRTPPLFNSQRRLLRWEKLQAAVLSLIRHHDTWGPKPHDRQLAFRTMKLLRDTFFTTPKAKEFPTGCFPANQ